MKWYEAISPLAAFRPKDPYAAAAPHLQGIEPQSRQAYQPWIDRGNQAAEQTGGTYQRMLEDPFEFENNIRRNYSESEGYKRDLNKLTNLHNSRSALSGSLGTPGSEDEYAELVKGLLDSHYGDYRNSIMGIQGAGLAGQQNYANKGYEANSSLQDILANIAQQRAGLAYGARAQKNQWNSDALKLIGGGVMGAAGGGAGGGIF